MKFILFFNLCSLCFSQTGNTDSIEVFPEKETVFIGGVAEMKTQLMGILEYPEQYEDTEKCGKIYLTLTIETYGTISSLEQVKKEL